MDTKKTYLVIVSVYIDLCVVSGLYHKGTYFIYIYYISDE